MKKDGLKPVFIIGCPRSGTTILLKVLASHKEFAWISDFQNANPFDLNLSKRNKVYSLPIIGDDLYGFRTIRTKNFYRLKRFLPMPAEPWNFYNSYIKKFKWRDISVGSPQSLTESDIVDEEKSNFSRAVQKICEKSKKKRFLSKYTDFSRMLYLLSIFPDAKFIHIIRDGRAVAASYTEKISSKNFGALSEKDFWVEIWPDEWKKDWEKYGDDLSFTLYQWKFFLDGIWADAERMNSDQYYEVKYKDFVESPVETYKRISGFCELSTDENDLHYIRRANIVNQNHKWREKYPDAENMFSDIIKEARFKKLLD